MAECSFPLTGKGCVTRIYSSLAVIDIVGEQFVLREKLPELSMTDLQALTGAPLRVDGPLTDLVAPELDT